VQAALLQLRASISSAEVLLKEQAPAAEIDTVLASAREEISAIHIDVKDLAQTITIVEEVSAGQCMWLQACCCRTRVAHSTPPSW